MAYFYGPWFVTPKETPLFGQIPFYKQEALLSTISDSNPLLSVVGKCTVLETKDYTSSRPTQYREPDCYVCDSVYDESKRAVRGALPESGLKQYELGPSTLADEIYFFKTAINVQKVKLNNAFSVALALTLMICQSRRCHQPPSPRRPRSPRGARWTSTTRTPSTLRRQWDPRRRRQ